MQRFYAGFGAFLMVFLALSGCSGKKAGDGDDPGEPDPSTFGSTTYDRALGNNGFHVAGSPLATGTPLLTESAAQLDILDASANDAAGLLDKATFLLDAKETGLNVQATLKQMGGGTGEHYGGTGQAVDIFGTSGVGPSTLPLTKAYLFASGMAQLRVNDKFLDDWTLVYVAVTQGLRDKDHKPVATPDATDLEFHVFFPGVLAPGNRALDPSVAPDGFLYYYFETVGVSHLSDADKAAVGRNLVAPEQPNQPPKAVGKVLLAGATVTHATQEGDNQTKVTFDAKSSADPDGSIAVWVWNVMELSASGQYEKPADTTNSPATVTGASVEYTFTAPGPKSIKLTVLDDRGASASTTFQFYVDRHVVTSFATSQAQSAGGGPVCTPNVNCLKGLVKVGPGLEKLKLVFKNKGSQEPTGIHIDLYDPDVVGDPAPSGGPTPIKSSDTKELSTDKSVVKKIGIYQYWVWWNAGVTVAYDVDATMTYTPA